VQLQLKEFLSLTGGKLLRIPLAVLSVSLLARAVGPDGVGQWAMILAVATLSHSFLINWTQASNIRFGREEWVLQNSLANTWAARWPMIAVGTCLAFGLIFFQPFSFLDKLFNLPSSWWPLILMFAFGQWCLFESQSIARVTDKITRLTLIPIWVDLATISFLSVVLLQFPQAQIEWVLSGVIIVITLVSAITWIIGFRDSHSWGGKSNWEERKKVIKYSWPLLPGLLFAYLSNWGDHIILQYFRSAKEVGLFSISFQAMQVLMGLASSMSILFLPKLIEKKLSETGVEQNYLTRICPTIISLWLMTIIPALVFVPWLFSLVFGKEFLEAIPILLLLCAAVPGSIFTAIYAILYESQGRLGKSSYYCSIAFLINIIISLALVAKYGGIGVSIGTTVSFFALQTLFLLDQHRYLKVPSRKTIVLLLFSLIYGLSQYFIGENLLFRVGGTLMGLACLILLIRRFNMIDKTILSNLLSGKLFRFRTFFCRLLIQEKLVH
jgi:O-antigen/teichoic acid export membrane protein